MPKIVKTTEKSKKYGAGHELLQYDAKGGNDLPKNVQPLYDEYAAANAAAKVTLEKIVTLMREHAKTKLGIPGAVDVMVGYDKVTLDAVETAKPAGRAAKPVQSEKELAADIGRIFGAAKA